MMVKTLSNIPMDCRVLGNYIRKLVDRFFKILPMREDEEETLPIYMESLRDELLGCSRLILSIQYDADFLGLIATLQYLIDHSDDSVDVYRREVFKSIKVCNKLRDHYCYHDQDCKED